VQQEEATMAAMAALEAEAVATVVAVTVGFGQGQLAAGARRGSGSVADEEEVPRVTKVVVTVERTMTALVVQ
jgi:hypothetical protein